MPETFWVLENPNGSLRRQLYMHCMRDKMHTVDYCKYGHPIQKRTNFWTNMPWHPRLKCKKDCEWFLRPNCRTGRHQVSIGGHGGMGLSPKLKNNIPHQLLDELLRVAMAHSDLSGKGRPWVLDLFSGYQSLRSVVEAHGLIYKSVDIQGQFGDGIVTDLEADFMDHTIPSVIQALGMDPDSLVLIWLSPPCQTFSRLDQAQRTPHRNHKTKHKQAVSHTAICHDALVMHTINCVNDYCAS